MRKVFDDGAGKHVAKPAVAVEIFDQLPLVEAALEIKCPECNAKPRVRCGSIIDASKYLDVPHAGRVELARKGAAR